MKWSPLLLALLADPAAAAPPPPPPNVVAGVLVRAPRRLDELEVRGDWCTELRDVEPGPAPKVVDSWPRPGAVVPDGPLTLRLTFDRTMTCAWVIDYNGGEDTCDAGGVWDFPARRTFTMRCRVRPGERYDLMFGEVEGAHFRSRTGVEAEPYEMSFSAAAGAAGVDPGSGEEVLGRLACNSRRFFGLFNPCRYTRLKAERDPPG